MRPDTSTRIAALLRQIYGEEATAVMPRVIALMNRYRDRVPFAAPRNGFYKERDVAIITYGDMVRADGEAPLATLERFLTTTLTGLISTVHILPFYPYTSDDGYSVVDYLAVDPNLGTWDDIAQIGRHFRLMIDAVINHVSQHSDWFQRFKRGEKPYVDYFTVVDPATDLSAVFRPRALPLLTPVDTSEGVKHVWTTFSDDQIDLNFASPDLLLEILTVVLEYVVHGGSMIRLDAIGFMWKEIGTRCLHLPQAHAIIQLMRAMLDEVAPGVALVTETNVPHQENISYFGDGTNEAQMVYNFSLPPLTLHAFHTGEATTLARWASSLTLPSERVSFFNFLASHDGIGVTPARGILSDHAIDQMGERVRALGGLVSYKTNSDGSESAYELNINYLDALGDPTAAESVELKARRFLASQAIMLALRGVPIIYFHSLYGSQGWPEGVAQTGRHRTINREKVALQRLERELAGGLRKLVFGGFRRLLQVRTTEPAFNPYGGQVVLDLHPAAFVVERTHAGQTILCLHNVSDQPAPVDLPYGGSDLLSGQPVPAGAFTLAPYGILWLAAEPNVGTFERLNV